MTPLQVLRQAKQLLTAAVWPDGAGAVVFHPAAIVISTGFYPELLGELVYPLAVLSVADGASEDENPKLGRTSIAVRVVVRQEGDRLGAHALIGGQRTATAGTSVNRGLLEVEAAVQAALAALGPSAGESFYLASVSEAAPESIADGVHLVSRTYTYEAALTGAASYPEVYALTASVAAGTVTLSWYDPYARFDLLNIMVRRIAGSTAPTPTTGTLVANVALAVQTKTNAPGSGTWTYGLWGAYDETGAGSQERFSDLAASVTVTV